MCVHAQLLQSYTTLCHPMGCTPPGSSVHGILQARILEWWRRNWQPIPIFLPGESQGRRSLVSCRLWGRKSQTWLKWLSSRSSILFSIVAADLPSFQQSTHVPFRLYPHQHLLFPLENGCSNRCEVLTDCGFLWFTFPWLVMLSIFSGMHYLCVSFSCLGFCFLAIPYKF